MICCFSNLCVASVPGKQGNIFGGVLFYGGLNSAAFTARQIIFGGIIFGGESGALAAAEGSTSDSERNGLQSCRPCCLEQFPRLYSVRVKHQTFQETSQNLLVYIVNLILLFILLFVAT